MKAVGMDFMGRNAEGGQVLMGNTAQKLASCGFDANALRPYWAKNKKTGVWTPYITRMESGKPIAKLTGNATLRKDEWKLMDDVLLKVKQERLGAVEDLTGRGLTFNIPNGLGTTSFEYEDISDITSAEMSMDGVTRSQQDVPTFGLKQLPMPIIHKDFFINARKLESSRTRGEPLDTTTIELASRQVLEKSEENLVTGTDSFAFGDVSGTGVIYGYEDDTNANTVTLSKDWDASDKTGSLILADVLNMKQSAINAKYFGPYMLYIPTAYETVIDKDFKTNSDKTIRARILEIAQIDGVKVLDKMTANTVMLVQLTSDVVRLVNGMALTVVEWDSQGGMVHHFKVMMIQVPQLRADSDGNSGIVRLE